MAELREGWNFHGDIASNLETCMRSLFGEKFNTYANNIEYCKFIESMEMILTKKADSDVGLLIMVKNFIVKNEKYHEKSYFEIKSVINDEQIYDIFIEYKELLELIQK